MIEPSTTQTLHIIILQRRATPRRQWWRHPTACIQNPASPGLPHWGHLGLQECERALPEDSWVLCYWSLWCKICYSKPHHSSNHRKTNQQPHNNNKTNDNENNNEPKWQQNKLGLSGAKLSTNYLLTCWGCGCQHLLRFKNIQ